VRGRDRARRLILGTGIVGFTLSAAGGASSADRAADVARCATITAPDERLACYDALGCAGIVAADQRLACYDALAEPKRSGPRTAPADAARPASSDSDAKSFGLSKSQLPATPEGPKLINARVTQVTVDRLGNVRMLLDNGQSWTFNDPDALLKPGDSVTIRRAALGSFLLTAGRRSYRAQRLE
jgi:hypothetical protein